MIAPVIIDKPFLHLLLLLTLTFLISLLLHRYLKRGVNEKGRVANDVETEQIVFEDVPEGCPTQISSVVQNRGSIPLFWSQETSRLNLKPGIICMSSFLLNKHTESCKSVVLHCNYCIFS